MSFATELAFRPDVFTYLLACWRFGSCPRFVCGQYGYELTREGSAEGFKCVPVIPLNSEPWSSARVERLQDGLWMLHAENSTEGAGIFLNEANAQYSASQMKIPGTVFRIGAADPKFLNFLQPLWPTIDQMEEGYWSNPNDDWQSQFRNSVELMRRFNGAKQIFVACRLRTEHPLVI